MIKNEVKELQKTRDEIVTFLETVSRLDAIAVEERLDRSVFLNAALNGVLALKSCTERLAELEVFNNA